jgi:hypothetical protein
MRGRIEFCDFLRDIGGQNAVAFPDDEMRGVGRTHQIDSVNVVLPPGYELAKMYTAAVTMHGIAT